MVPAPVLTGRRVRRACAGVLAIAALVLLAGCGSEARGPFTSGAGGAQGAATTPAAATTKPTASSRHKARKPRPIMARAPDPAVLAARAGLGPDAAKNGASATASAPRTSGIAEGAPSDAEVKRELAQAMGYKSGAHASTKSLVDKALLNPDGLVTAPPSAPVAVQAMITGGNQVAHLPYVYGGGHSGRWEDSAYDCSGSVSFALAAAGFLKTQLDSTALAKWGAPGPGKWVTIFANATHAWMIVAGVRFDTSGRTSNLGSRWQGATRSTAGFVERHPIGL